MKKMIIYGLGDRFFRYLDFIFDELSKHYDIIGVSDKKEILSNKKNLQWTFFERSKLMCLSFDLIMITSDRYYHEISQELIEEFGIKSETIVSMETIYTKICEKYFHISYFEGKQGIEIGGPSEIFRENIYAKCLSCDGVNFNSHTVWWEENEVGYLYNGKKLGEMFITDVTNLFQIADAKYDFCLSSNNLEHIANPVKALYEMVRVLKMEGVLLVLVPDKNKCFDHRREFTPFEHMLQDYESDIQENDLTHLHEILELHDYSMDIPCGGKEQFYERALKNVENRCLHHHVFCQASLEKCFKHVGLDVIEIGRLQNDIFILGKKMAC